MDDLIVKPKKSSYLLFTSVLLAFWNIHPFYTLCYNWFIYLKISVILILLGFDFQYKFTKNQKAIKEYTFLKMPFLRRKIVEAKIDYLSIFKTTTASKYQIRLFYNSKYKIILCSKSYNEVVTLSSQISHLLKIDFFNPFEDYEQY